MLVCRKAPDFRSPAVLGDGKIEQQYQLSDAIRGKYGLIVFYPLDFTFVCPTELVALNNRIDEFKKLHVEVIGISRDSVFTHQAWRNTPVEKGGIGPVQYTLVADMKHDISRAYGVESEDGVSFRGTFLIDKQGIIRHAGVNDLPIGRSIDEMIRLINALQFHETNGEVCPAGWSKGRSGFKASAEGVASFLAANAEEL